MGGMLHQAGYYMGDDLYPPRESNPKGFFENATINNINEKILEKYDFALLNNNYPLFYKTYSPYKPGGGQRWLSYIPNDVIINNFDIEIETEIQKVIKVAPHFAYKDPRFNYTLSIWNKLLKSDTLFICIFRQPDITIESIINMSLYDEHLSNFYIDKSLAYKLWFNSYQHLLCKLNKSLMRKMIFIHYEQLLTGVALPILSEKLHTHLDFSFVFPDLNRSQSTGKIPNYVFNTYKELCKLSGFEH
jgi:hypothetical protein